MLKPKRILCLFLALVLVLSVHPFAAASPASSGLTNFKKVNIYQPGQFTDVKSGQWYAANVQAAYELGLMQGNANGTFNPTGSIKVIETIITACRLHSIYHTGKSEFSSGSPWYQPYVDYAVNYGIIGADEYSNYNAPATRAQFISILAGALPKEALPAVNDISMGSIPDVPFNTGFADEVYLMYNAGILVGNDAYGTFDPEGSINRAQSAAIITRMADTSLRITKTLKVRQLVAPTKIIIRDVSASPWVNDAGEYHPGQRIQLDVSIHPGNAVSGITWTSSDPAVATVNEYGRMEVRSQGEAVITATAYNGVQGSFKVSVPHAPAQLRYELTADGKGYEVTGCDTDAYTVHVPAVYSGLPVVSIREGAFIGCEKLRYFTVDADQAIFYEEGGVIFADLPEKTLVAFPPAYDFEVYYYAPDDTVAVASYAFAGLCNKLLVNITFPEGLQRLGDCVFAENKNWNVNITIPRSLTEIGDDIQKGYHMSINCFLFYEHCTFHSYAEKNRLPFLLLGSSELDLVAAESSTPDSLPREQLIPANPKTVKYLSSYDNPLFGNRDTRPDIQLDLSQWEATHDGEIRLRLERRWLEILPDVNGNTELPYSRQTGLYGAGRTESDAILRGYDMDGNLIAMQYVSGDFSFRFPGVYDLGVEGGTNTHLTVLPVEPTYISAAGNYEIDLSRWENNLDGNVFEYYIAEIPNPAFEFCAHSTQAIGYSVRDAATGQPASGILNEDRSIGYTVYYFHSPDPSMAQNLDGCFLCFGGMETVLDTEELECIFGSDFEDPEGLARQLAAAWGQVKKAMLGTYFPTSVPLRKLTVCGDETERANAGANGVIHTGPLDEMIVYIHEMVHAVDYNAAAFYKVAPAAWAEGRAEYISYKIAETYGYEYTNHHTQFDWSWLTEEDKADFFRCYYFCNDGTTEYDVGYHFLRYLNEVYGENVSCRIMENLSALTEWENLQRSEHNALLFKQCVEDATEVGVFQNFVRDVIEK